MVFQHSMQVLSIGSLSETCSKKRKIAKSCAALSRCRNLLAPGAGQNCYRNLAIPRWLRWVPKRLQALAALSSEAALVLTALRLDFAFSFLPPFLPAFFLELWCVTRDSKTPRKYNKLTSSSSLRGAELRSSFSQASWYRRKISIGGFGEPHLTLHFRKCLDIVSLCRK
ncbi:hypothetical protein K439DRAFT_570289 [Ramaria rubella]|nr:hypothetical protein K439DRAFT_570289 [Ramaria rubella]